MFESPHRVVVLALPNVVAFELGLPARFFDTDSLRPGWPAAPTGPAPYDVRYVTADNQPVRTSAGYAVSPTHDVTELAAADTVVLCGMPVHQVMRDGTLDPQVNAALDLVPESVRWLSICTGAFVLAARGLLDGQRATTHWVHADQFRALFPRVELDAEVLFVDNGKVLTSAGNAAGIDLLLHVIRSDLGADTANRVARGCVVAPMRDGGQRQFIDRPTPSAAPDGTGPARAWALEHLSSELSLNVLASRSGMSVRTFTRRFRDETGQTAGQWIIQARVERARELLEGSDLPVDRVAERAGFGTAAAFRTQFRASVGVAPSAYRRSFRELGSASVP